jgi:hypothetical protein
MKDWTAASIPVLRWAAKRAKLTSSILTSHFPNWSKWLRGEEQPTLEELEDFARLTEVPFGFLFLPKPPKHLLPNKKAYTVSVKGVGQTKIFDADSPETALIEFALVHGLKPQDQEPPPPKGRMTLPVCDATVDGKPYSLVIESRWHIYPVSMSCNYIAKAKEE